MAKLDVTGLAQWYKFLDSDALMLLAPGVIGGCTIYFSARIFRHMAVLPSCIIMLMVVFYALLWATGTSVQEATENGWITESVVAVPFLVSLFDRMCVLLEIFVYNCNSRLAHGYSILQVSHMGLSQNR